MRLEACTDDTKNIYQQAQRAFCKLLRGQIHNYPITPSIFRKGVDRNIARDKLNRFADWVHRTPELASLHSKKDSILAVAQHYGIPTPLLDFTTSPEVAGFFASDGTLRPTASEDEKQTCIICVHREQFEAAWRDFNERARRDTGFDLVRVVEVDVKNLWRLQAQEGLFIQAQVDSALLEMFSGFRRILFPYTGPFRGIQREHVYPTKQSHLEILLEHFFYAERFDKAIDELKSIMPVFYAPKAEFARRGDPEAFISGQLPSPHSSWTPEVRTAWMEEPDERIKSAIADKRLELRVHHSATSPTNAKMVADAVGSALKHDLSIRTQSLDWSVLGDDGHELEVDDEQLGLDEDGQVRRFRCSQVVALMWDGMRRLPYSDDQIATCIGTYVAVAASRDRYAATKELFGEISGVELASGRARTRGFISERSFLECIRPDLWELLHESHVVAVRNSQARIVDEIMARLFVPERLFVFERFVEVFAKEVIPTQALIRLDPGLILFSPARVEIFGQT